MLFCSNCGNELPKEGKFCSNCGSAVGDGVNLNQRKTVYEGTIHKCPSCGEVLEAFVGNCPSCGYELRNMSVRSAIKEFTQKFEQAKDDEQRVHLIRNFTIPNTKEDILEFIILASTNAETYSTSEEITNSWLVKLEQCNHKANLILSNDPDYIKIKSIYDKTYIQIKKVKHKKVSKTVSLSSVDVVGNILKAIPKCLGMIAAMITFCIAIRVDQTGGNSVGYEMLGGILLIVSAAMLGRKSVSYMEIFICAICGGISFLLAKQLDNGSFFQLVGFVVLVIVVVNYFRTLIKREE